MRYIVLFVHYTIKVSLCKGNTAMMFRQAVAGDLDGVVAIIGGAKAYLRSLGIDQWQGEYPDRATLHSDIAGGEAYVLEKDGRLAATVTLSFAGEPSYRDLKGGAWETGDNYGVIHRMAISPDFRGSGLSTRLFREMDRLCRERGAEGIKTDTHPDNKQMQYLMKKNGYACRGTIFFQGGDKIAFEKIL